ARANIDANLNPNERANIKIVNNKVVLVNPNAINLNTASNGYKLLYKYIGPNAKKTGYYYGVASGQSVTLMVNGKPQSFSFSNVQNSGDVVNYRSANVVDIVVAVGGGPQVADSNTPPQGISFPEYLVFAHGLGHGVCGLGMCAVDIENDLRREQNLPLRSTSVGHEILQGGKLVGTGTTFQRVDGQASQPEIITTTTPVLQTTIPQRPLEPLPPPPKPKPIP
ncbi:MAG: hypothetical protein ACRENZ_09300, partial [Thermodesulfobacteriota bacterium]